MFQLTRLVVALWFLSTVASPPLNAQPQPNRGGPTKQGKSDSSGRAQAGEDRDDEKSRSKPLPTDPKLLLLHKDFVLKAEKLAQDYERGQDLEKAKSCYEEILKLVPEYPKAKQMLAALREKEATAQRKVIDIFANKDWQDTGIVLADGKPIRISATGTWTFNMSARLSPAGMEIPKELRDFPLGALVAYVNTGDPKTSKPFLVGENLELIPKYAGRLMMRIYDAEVNDNTGKINVEITGTFGK